MELNPPVSRAAQIAEQVRRQIERGEYKPGQRLPTDVELAKQLGVATPTANRAMRILADRGLVSREQGRGTFVRERIDTTHIAAEALHRRAEGLSDPVGECPDPGEHEKYVSLAGAVLEAMRQTGARPD